MFMIIFTLLEKLNANKKILNEM